MSLVHTADVSVQFSSENVPTPEAEATDVSSPVTCAQIIAGCKADLYRMAQFKGEVSGWLAARLVENAGNTYTRARDVVPHEFEEASSEYKGIWAASLQANFALATRCVTQMDDTDFEAMKGEHTIGMYGLHFNNLLEQAISALSKLRAGKQIFEYNFCDLSARVADHVRTVRTVSPRHRFPSSVCIETLLKNDS